jgi:hypothetical protein
MSTSCHHAQEPPSRNFNSELELPSMFGTLSCVAEHAARCALSSSSYAVPLERAVDVQDRVDAAWFGKLYIDTVQGMPGVRVQSARMVVEVLMLTPCPSMLLVHDACPLCLSMMHAGP